MGHWRGPFLKRRHSRREPGRSTARRQEAGGRRQKAESSNEKPETRNGVKVHSVGIIMNGVTGRMGANQHLGRSILAIIAQGGVEISDHETILPRSEERRVGK